MPRTKFGNPILKRQAKPIPLSKIKSLKNLIRNMFFTMRRVDGVGLAAPQIGKSVRLAVIEIPLVSNETDLPVFPKTVLINPKILSASKEKLYDYEGCLSLDDVRGEVPRHKKIKVQYRDHEGREHKETYSGYIARVFQHEIDHLNGIVYVDRMEDMSTLMTSEEYRKRVRRVSK